MPEFKLPDVGEGLTEAEIVSWKVQVGDVIAVNDVIVEIETAKSLVELPSPYAGEVTALLVDEGVTVAVGTPIIVVGEPAAPGGEPATPPRAEPVAPEAPIDTNVPPEGNPTLVGYGPREAAVGRRPRRSAAPAPASSVVEPASSVVEPASSVVEPASSVVEPVDTRSLQVLAKPPVRKLAKDLGIDLRSLTPSGDGGVVTRDDVERAAGSPQRPAAASPVATDGGERREPVKGVRRAMAQAMTESAFTVPHVTIQKTVDVTRTVEFVERLRTRREFRDVKVSPLLVLARAVAMAVRAHPLLNSWFDTAAQEVVLRDRVNLGIAAATPRGLVVPNIKGAEQRSLLDLAEQLGALTATAREGRTSPSDMAQGTITITNVGVFGIDMGTPIINPGESAIVCFGSIERRPWVVVDADGAEQLAIRSVTTLALSFDHRHIDGQAGSRFLADLAAVLEDPANALLL